MAFVATALSPRIGTEIRADTATLLGGEHAAQIRRLLEERGVLLFPELNLTDAEQIAFAKTLGPLEQELSIAKAAGKERRAY